MMQSIMQSGGWLVTMWLMVGGLVACGGTMGDSSGQGGNDQLPVDPDTPVSGVPGQIDGSGGMVSGSNVTGRVLDPAGNPVVGAMVMPQSTDTPPHALPEIAVMTGNDGRYQWSLPPGRYNLTIHLDGYPPTTSENVTVVQGQTTSRDITLRKQ